MGMQTWECRHGNADMGMQAVLRLVMGTIQRVLKALARVSPTTGFEDWCYGHAHFRGMESGGGEEQLLHN